LRDRKTNRQADRQRYGDTERPIVREAIQSNKERERKTDKRTERDRETRQSNKETERKKDRQGEEVTERHT
jgi:hypothetical protein